jgi:hypothetical protein
MLICEGWIPQDKFTSRGFLFLGSEIAEHVTSTHPAHQQRCRGFPSGRGCAAFPFRLLTLFGDAPPVLCFPVNTVFGLFLRFFNRRSLLQAAF